MAIISTKQFMQALMTLVHTLVPVVDIRKFAQHEQIDMLARIKTFHGMVPTLLTNASLLSAKFTAIGHGRRYAIVGGPGWMGTLTQMMGSMLPISMHQFNAEQEGDAWAWLKA
jgi:hypothetical protein